MTAATCGWVTMSMRELDRLKVIEAIIEGRLKPAAAAQRLRLTTRQVKCECFEINATDILGSDESALRASWRNPAPEKEVR